MHLEFVFAAVSNAELCSKMASYATNQEMFDIKTLNSCSTACVALVRQYGREFLFALTRRETLSAGLLG
jgi:hypothetical protein